jgi:hypothetical protein
MTLNIDLTNPRALVTGVSSGMVFIAQAHFF